MKRSHCECCLCGFSSCLAEYWFVIGHFLLSTVQIGFFLIALPVALLSVGR